MRRILTALAAGAAMIVSGAAGATDIANTDDRDHEVIVVIGKAAPATVTLRAGESKFLCPDGCSVIMETDGWEIKATAWDEVVIKNGRLFIRPSG